MPAVDIRFVQYVVADEWLIGAVNGQSSSMCTWQVEHELKFT